MRPRFVSPPQWSTEKRFGWYRHPNGFIRDARWRVVAKKTGLHVTMIGAVVTDMLEAANQTKPRGSLQDWAFDVCAVALDLEVVDVENIYAGVVEIGFVDQNSVVEWGAIAREKEDTTSTERSHRRRAKIKEEQAAASIRRLAALGGARNGVAGVTATPALHGQPLPNAQEFQRKPEPGNGGAGVTATLRSDQIKVTAGEALQESSAVQVEARRWLQGTPDEPGEGALIVASALSKDPDFAGYVVRNWTADLQNDHAALRSILLGAKDLRGARFQAVVHERIRAARNVAERGAALPFNPVPLSGSG